MKRYFCLFFTLALSSCSYTNRNIAKIATNDPELKYAQSIVAAVYENKFSEIQSVLTPDLSEKAFTESVGSMRTLVPSNPAIIEPFEVNITDANGSISKEIRFELTFSNGQKSILDMYTRGDKDSEKIAGFHFQEVSIVNKMIAFSLQDKPFINYLFLVLAACIQIIVVIAAFGCLFLRPHKWLLWLLFISFGFVLFDLNWTTNHLSIQLFRATMLAGYISKKGLEYSPWYVGVSFPLGAIIFLKCYWKFILAKIKHQV